MKFQTHRTVEIKLSNVPIKNPRINGYLSNRLYENQMVVVVFDRNSHKMFEYFSYTYEIYKYPLRKHSLLRNVSILRFDSSSVTGV